MSEFHQKLCQETLALLRSQLLPVMEKESTGGGWKLLGAFQFLLFTASFSFLEWPSLPSWRKILFGKAWKHQPTGNRSEPLIMWYWCIQMMWRDEEAHRWFLDFHLALSCWASYLIEILWRSFLMLGVLFSSQWLKLSTFRDGSQTVWSRVLFRLIKCPRNWIRLKPLETNRPTDKPTDRPTYQLTWNFSGGWPLGVRSLEEDQLFNVLRKIRSEGSTAKKKTFEKNDCKRPFSLHLSISFFSSQKAPTSDGRQQEVVGAMSFRSLYLRVQQCSHTTRAAWGWVTRKNQTGVGLGVLGVGKKKNSRGFL